jgi:hypothetical protein
MAPEKDMNFLTRNKTRTTLATALAAAGALTWISECAEANVVYPDYVDIDTFYGNLGAPILSKNMLYDVVTTGTDANGGFVFRRTGWDATVTEIVAGIPENFALGYAPQGYLNDQLKFSLSPRRVRKKGGEICPL